MIRTVALAAVVLVGATAVSAQTISQRGFVEANGVGFPQPAPNDTTQLVGDVLVREEVFFRPARWIQLAAGVDLRADSHDRVEDRWQLDFDDRGVLRPRSGVRRLSASLSAGAFSLEVGKQFIRWGRADLLNPTDRFAPHDFLDVVNLELLAVNAVRPSVQIGDETFEAVWVPHLTPSRSPLFDQRWTVVTPEAEGLRIIDGGAVYPAGSQHGLRWSHAASRVEASLSYFDGYHHLPAFSVRQPSPDAVELTRNYPELRSYGGDIAVPAGWLTVKGELTYFTSPHATTDEYVLYVVQVERQARGWLLIGGYAGEAVTQSRGTLSFSPDRGLARSIIVRTVRATDPARTILVELVAHQNGDGAYVKGEYSRVIARHWRLTMNGVGIAGEAHDYLGQYNRNSHGSIALRFSY